MNRNFTNMYGFNCQELFAPYEKQLTAFASRHNLRVEKYPHDMPQWSFSFLHPLGGVGRVDIQINKKREIGILKFLTLDDYKNFRRSARSTSAERVEQSVEKLEEALLNSIKEILTWNMDSGGITSGLSRHSYVDPASFYPKVRL